MMEQLELEYLTLLSSLPVANIAFFGCTANAQSSPSAWPFQSKTKSVTEPWFYSLLKDGRYNYPRLEYSFTAAQPHSTRSIVWCCFRHILSYFTTIFFIYQIHALSTCPQYASHSYKSFLMYLLHIFLANKSQKKNYTSNLIVLALYLIYRDLILETNYIMLFSPEKETHLK